MTGPEKERTASAAAKAARELLNRRGRREPLEVTVRRTVVKPSSDGPVPTGEVRVRRYRDGERIE